MENVKHVLSHLCQTMIIQCVYARAHKLWFKESVKNALVIKPIHQVILITVDLNRQYLQTIHKHSANVDGMVLNLTASMNVIVIME